MAEQASQQAVTSPATYDQQLERALSLKENISITLSSVTPASSVFIIVPALISGLGGASVTAMVIAAVIAIFVGMCYAELSVRYPITGGEYTWAARLLGKPVGFGAFGVTLITGVLIISLIGLGVGPYLAVISKSFDSKNTVVVAIILTTIVSCLRIRLGAWVVAAFLGLEVVAIAVLTILGFTHVTRGPGVFFKPQHLSAAGALSPVSWGIVASLISVALFAYNGYGAAVYYAEETKGAKKTIGRAIMISLAVTVVVELLPLCAVILGSSSLTKLMADKAPMNWFLLDRGNVTINKLVSVAIALAIFNAVIAIQIQIARLVFSSARDRSWPLAVDKVLGSVHGKTKTPIAATLLVGLASLLIARFVSFNFILTATGSGLVIIYVLVAVAAIVLRRREGDTASGQGYRMPWWPVPPIAVLLMMAYVVEETLKVDSKPLIYAAVFFILGVVWYLGFIKPSKHERWTLPELADE